MLEWVQPVHVFVADVTRVNAQLILILSVVMVENMQMNVRQIARDILIQNKMIYANLIVVMRNITGLETMLTRMSYRFDAWIDGILE